MSKHIATSTVIYFIYMLYICYIYKYIYICICITDCDNLEKIIQKKYQSQAQFFFEEDAPPYVDQHFTTPNSQCLRYT